MAYYIDDGMSDVCSVVSGLMAAVKIKLLMTILVPWSAAGLGAWRRGGGPRTGWGRGMLLAAVLLSWEQPNNITTTMHLLGAAFLIRDDASESGRSGFDLLLRRERYGRNDVVGTMRRGQCGEDSAVAALILMLRRG